MRAALLQAPNTPFEVVDDVEIDDPRPGQVLVRVTHCGVCHSDLSNADGTFPVGLPVILGHEAAGTVEAVGAGVTRLVPGDRVLLTPSPPCGRCYWCVRGERSLCVDASAVLTSTFPDGSTGLSRGGEVVYRGLGVGAFGERVITQEAGAARLPADTPLDVACVLGCAVQTGVGAVLNTAAVEEGATVLVVGLGGIGLSVVQGARIAGASRVVAVDPVAARRDAATRFGATDVLDPAAADDLPARVRDLTDGIGVDYAFDAAGAAGVVETAIWSTRPGGTTVCVGAPPIDTEITIAPAVVFAATERKLVGCFLGSSDTHREASRLLGLWRAGRLDLEGMITARRPLAEIDAAFADLAAGRGIRTVLEI